MSDPDKILPGSRSWRNVAGRVRILAPGTWLVLLTSAVILIAANICPSTSQQTDYWNFSTWTDRREIIEGRGWPLWSQYKQRVEDRPLWRVGGPAPPATPVKTATWHSPQALAVNLVTAFLLLMCIVLITERWSRRKTRCVQFGLGGFLIATALIPIVVLLERSEPNVWWKFHETMFHDCEVGLPAAVQFPLYGVLYLAAYAVGWAVHRVVGCIFARWLKGFREPLHLLIAFGAVAAVSTALYRAQVARQREQVLEACLHIDEISRRVAIMGAISGFDRHAEHAVAPLVRALWDDEVYTYEEGVISSFISHQIAGLYAAQALGRIGRRAESAVPALKLRLYRALQVVATADDEDWETWPRPSRLNAELSEAVLKALSEIDPEAPGVLPAAATALRYEGLEDEAGRLIRKIGPPAVPWLVKMLCDTDRETAQRAANTLARMGQLGLPALYGALENGDSRSLALESTRAGGLCLLKALLDDMDRRPEASRGQIALLQRLAEIPRWDYDEQFTDCMCGGDQEQRIVAAWMDVLPQVLRLSQAEDCSLRLPAIQLIANADLRVGSGYQPPELREVWAAIRRLYDPWNERIVRRLVGTLTDPDSEVRYAASNGLTSRRDRNKWATAMLAEFNEPLAHPDVRVRLEAAVTVWRVTERLDLAMPVLVEACRLDEAHEEAMFALRSIANGARGSLLDLLAHADPDPDRHFVFVLLLVCGDKGRGAVQAVPWLMQFEDDSRWTVSQRHSATVALERICDDVAHQPPAILRVHQ